MKTIYLFHLVLITVMVISFQNCQSPFEVAQTLNSSTTSISENENSVVVPPQLIPPPPHPSANECNDGIDNDGDGLVDWQYDQGCFNHSDQTESAGIRSKEQGWSTFDLPEGSKIIYVSSSDGNDSNDGLTPTSAVKSINHGANLITDGSSDFLLLKRGDTFRTEGLYRFKSGKSFIHPLLISSYGDSTSRPIVEVGQFFLNDDGQPRSNIAVIGLDIVGYKKIPNSPNFNGKDGGAFRFVSTGSKNLLFEDNIMTYLPIVLQSLTTAELRRNTIYKAYLNNSCAYHPDGTRNVNGDFNNRIGGIFAGSVTDLLIEENFFDHNGWNTDVKEACASIYSHNAYMANITNLKFLNNFVIRSSSINLKVISGKEGDSDNAEIIGNIMAEGEIGLSMGGNSTGPQRFRYAKVNNNIFTDIGRSLPTTRGLSWYVELIDNVDTEFIGNYLIKQPDLGNVFGLSLGGGSNSGLIIRENTVHGLHNKTLALRGSSANFKNIKIQSNKFISQRGDACLIEYNNASSEFIFSNNEYQSPASQNSWFCQDGQQSNIDSWKNKVEASASISSYSPPSGGRNLDSYAKSLGIGNHLNDFAREARRQSRHFYRIEYTTQAASDYIRGGY